MSDSDLTIGDLRFLYDLPVGAAVAEFKCGCEAVATLSRLTKLAGNEKTVPSIVAVSLEQTQRTMGALSLLSRKVIGLFDAPQRVQLNEALNSSWIALGHARDATELLAILDALIEVIRQTCDPILHLVTSGRVLPDGEVFDVRVRGGVQ